MKLHGVTHFSAFRNIPNLRQQRQEAFDAHVFFEELQNHVLVNDVARGPNPPDFVLSIAGRKVGAELTRLNPKVFGRGGHALFAEFKRWKAEGETDRSPYRKFQWGESSLRDWLGAFQSQVQRKAKRALRYAGDYDEFWLLFQAESGSPAGALVERKFSAKKGQNDLVMEFASKHLFEMDGICRMAAPFSCVILFSGPHLLAFSRGKKSHSLPGPDAELLKRGAKAASELLDWRAEFFSVSRRSGDLVLSAELTRMIPGSIGKSNRK